MKRVGIYPGTFDPVHRGHIDFCLRARQSCGLDEVVLLPEVTPRGKHGVSGIDHRRALLELAAAGLDGIRVLQLQSPQFTIAATWPELQRYFSDAELTLLVGSDVIRGLESWQGLETVLPELRFAVGIRRKDTAGTVRAVMANVIQHYGQPIRYDIIEGPYSALASLLVRSGHAGWLPNKDMEHYILRHGLYV